MFAADKIMFEIYREGGFNRRYRVVYFTELDEHNKEFEINAAMAGDHFYDGFIAGKHDKQAKQAIGELLDRLNAGETVAAATVEELLSPYAAV